MSIFQNINAFSENCTAAVVNISQIGDDRAFTVTLQFKQGDNSSTPPLSVGATYILDCDGKYKEGESVKAYVKILSKEGDDGNYTKKSHRYHTDVPECVYKDVDFIRHLFETCDDGVKRVY